MNIKTNKDIIKIIQDDIWMMNILKTVKKLNLPDWWIGAGFVRSKVWDSLHNYKVRTPMSSASDIDVIYFDKDDFSENEIKFETTQKEEHYEKLLKMCLPSLNWSVTNQARMHLFHGEKPYKSSEDALGQWVETATCIGVRLDQDDNLILTAPRGIGDLVNLILRPTSDANNSIDLFYERVNKKQWLKKWPKLTIISN